MSEENFPVKLDSSFKSLTRLYNILKADLFRLESLVGPEGLEVIREIQDVEMAFNRELKNLQKLVKLSRDLMA